MKNMTRAIKFRQQIERRGAAAIEFAVVSPLLFLLVLGMFEVGRFINVGEMCTSASRFGARQATVSGSTVASVQTATKNYLTSSGVKGSAATVSIEAETAVGNGTFAAAGDLSTVAVGSAIRISVQVDFKQVTWLPNGFFSKLLPSNITGVTVMRKEST